MSSIDARINLKEIIVSGSSSSKATFVAMNDVPQKITARIISQYLRNLCFKLMMKEILKKTNVVPALFVKKDVI